MKRILSIIALLMAFAASGFADKTVYLDGNGVWNDGRFALEMKDANDVVSWTDFILAPGETKIYMATVTADITSIKICRMNSNYTENNEGYIWNYKGWYTSFDNNALFTIISWDDGVNGCTISTYTIADTPTVFLKADWNNWEGDQLTLGTATMVDLSSATTAQGFKLYVNDTWLGYDNVTLADANGLVSEGSGGNMMLSYSVFGYGKYAITADWTPNPSQTQGWTVTVTGTEYRDNIPGIVGDWTSEGSGWSNDQQMTRDESNPNIFTLTVDDFEVTTANSTWSYKLRTNGNWDTYNLPNGNSNYSKTFDEAGTYTLVFTANVSEHTLNLDVTKKTVLPGTVIWSSETPVAATWYTNNYDLIIDKSKFANVKVGDKIHVAVMNVPEGGPDYGSQVQLSDGWWVKVEGYMAVGSGNVSDASFVITGDMLKLFKERGMIVVGQNFSTDQVTVESIEGITGSDNSVWVGNSTSAITIKKEHFLTAHDWVYVGPETYDYAFEGIKAGDIIRVTASENENAGNKWLIAQYSGSDTNWAWKDYSTDLMPKFTTATGFDFVIPEDYIDQIKTDGVIINFSGYTVTQIELIIPNGDYYVINDLGSGWAVGSKMTESEGTYTATLTGMAGKYFAIVPSTSLNASGDALFSWANAARPVSDGNFLVEFKSYTGTDNITNTGSNVWAVQTENDADLTINFTPASKSFTLSCAKTIEMSSVGYRTYSNAQNYKVPDGTSVYYVKEVGKSIKLTAAESNNLPGTGTANKAGRGVILKGNGNVVITPTDPEVQLAALDGNMLVGSGDWNYGLSGYDSNYTCFILAIGGNGVGFYNATGTIGAHKAFLPILTSTLSTPGAREFLGFEEGNTTSIDVRSKMEDGRGDVYNLNGQRVAQPTKGLYIVNGRKVVIK